MKLRELIAEIRQSVYAVVIQWQTPLQGQLPFEVIGTAFAVSSEGHFLTANHVVNLHQNTPPGRQVGVNDKILLAQIHADGVTVSLGSACQVLCSSQLHDYAILHNQQVAGRVQNYLQLDFASRFEGEDVAICGYPMSSFVAVPGTNNLTMNLNLRVAAGIISSRRTDNGSRILEVDFPILPGNSGGPVFSQRTGKVLGISSATTSVFGANGSTIGHLGISRDVRNALADLKLHLPHL